MSAAASAPPSASSPGTVAGSGFHWPPALAVAWVTFLEFWRRWFLLGLLVIGLMPGILATFMPVAVQHPAERVELIILWGLGGVAFGGALGASLMASLQTPMEIEDRRIYGLVCRPVGRWRLMIGKMIGCAGFLAVYAAVCYAVLSLLTAYALYGQPDAGTYTITRTAQDALLLGLDTQSKHIRSYSGEAAVTVPFDFTAAGPIPDWGHITKDRYRWVLVTVVRPLNGQPDVGHVWDTDHAAFTCKINGRPLAQIEVDQGLPVFHTDFFMEASGHVVLIVPESLAAGMPANRVQIEIDPASGYFAAGDLFFLSDLAVYDTPKPAYDDNLQRKIPFVRTIVTISPGQTADYLLAQNPAATPAEDDRLFVGLVLKSATIFRDIFAVSVGIDRFNPDARSFQNERQAQWVVTERKQSWTSLAPPASRPDAAPVQPAGAPVTGTPAEEGARDFGPVRMLDLPGWRVLRLRGLPPVMGVRDSGSPFQLQCGGDVKFAAVRSNLWNNLFCATGLLFIQWLCLVVIIVAWSGNLSLGISVLCSLILAVSCYGSGAARSVLTEELRGLQYRERMHQLHPGMTAPPVSPWQVRLNRVMSGIIWTPPDFMQYSPTDRVKAQVDISYSEWGAAMLYLLLMRALPLSAVGLLVFQRREF